MKKSIIAVIIVIVLIVPLFIFIINRVQLQSFRENGYQLVDSARKYIRLHGEEDTTFDFPNNYKGLDYKGEIPDGGTLIIKDGRIKLFVYKDKNCLKKEFDIDEVATGKLITNNDRSKDCEIK